MSTTWSLFHEEGCLFSSSCLHSIPRGPGVAAVLLMVQLPPITWNPLLREDESPPCCAGVSSPAKIVDNHTYYCDTWWELKFPCCVPSSEKQKQTKPAARQALWVLFFQSVLTSCLWARLGKHIGTSFLIKKCFPGNILHYWAWSISKAGCREDLNMTWQVLQDSCL